MMRSFSVRPDDKKIILTPRPANAGKRKYNEVAEFNLSKTANKPDSGHSEQDGFVHKMKECSLSQKCSSTSKAYYISTTAESLKIDKDRPVVSGSGRRWSPREQIRPPVMGSRSISYSDSKPNTHGLYKDENDEHNEACVTRPCRSAVSRRCSIASPLPLIIEEKKIKFIKKRDADLEVDRCCHNVECSSNPVITAKYKADKPVKMTSSLVFKKHCQKTNKDEKEDSTFSPRLYCNKVQISEDENATGTPEKIIWPTTRLSSGHGDLSTKHRRKSRQFSRFQDRLHPCLEYDNLSDSKHNILAVNGESDFLSSLEAGEDALYESERYLLRRKKMLEELKLRDHRLQHRVRQFISQISKIKTDPF